MKIFSVVLGIFFSACMVFGDNILLLDTTAINNLSTWIKIFLYAPIFIAGVFFIFKFADNINFSPATFKPKKFFIISWLIIFISWLPVLFAQYPGIFAYDALVQIFIYKINLIWMHFPPIHTWLLGFCTITLGEFFNSYELGFLIYTLLQMLSLSCTFAIILIYMLKKKLPAFFIIAWQIFFMIFPLIPIMAISATKDIFYSIFFVLMILSLEENFLPTVLFGFMQIIFRSQGIHVFLIGMFAGFFLLKDSRLKILKCTAATIAIAAFYFAVINIFAVKNADDSLREMSSVPIVQLSRVATYENISAEDFAEIKKFIPDVESYADKISQGSSDNVKANFHADNPAEFFSLWQKFLFKYPTDYFDAFARLTVGLWYPSLEFDKYYSAQPYFQYESFKREDDFIIFVENPFENRTHKLFKTDASFQLGDRFISSDETKNNIVLIENKILFGLDWLNNFYKNLAYNYSYEKIPIIKFLFSTGFIFWLTLIYICRCIYKKNYRELFQASFICALWLTMFFGPITLFRYTLPIAMCIPIFFANVFKQ